MNEEATVGRYGLEDKVVVVTGAGSGIGRAIARGFAAEGATVVVAGRRVDALEETASAAPDRIHPIRTDVQDRASIAALVDGTRSRFGRIDVAVSNAAAYVNGPLDDVDAPALASLVDTNVTGVVLFAQAVIPSLRESRGSLLFTTSVSALRGDWAQSLYNATKGAQTTLMQSLALDLGPDGVRVNAVAPSATRTEISNDGLETPEARAAFANRVALGRTATPADMVGAYLFLASDDAAYITGVTLPVDGGTSASTGQPHLG
jgi:meso-butanediol dehydrogenase / (S,S)-butanediol dehydrogenase / diacetyl reductase